MAHGGKVAKSNRKPMSKSRKRAESAPGCAFQYYEVDGLIEKKDARLLDYGGVDIGWIVGVCRSTHSQPRLNRRTMTGEGRGICTRAGPPWLATAESCSFCVKFEATPEPA